MFVSYSSNIKISFINVEEISTLMHDILFPVLTFIEGLEDGSHLQPEYVAANKLIRTGIMCDCYLYLWYVTYIAHDSVQHVLQICETLLNRSTALLKKYQNYTTSVRSNPGVALFITSLVYRFSCQRDGCSYKCLCPHLTTLCFRMFTIVSQQTKCYPHFTSSFDFRIFKQCG